MAQTPETLQAAARATVPDTRHEIIELVDRIGELVPRADNRNECEAGLAVISAVETKAQLRGISNLQARLSTYKIDLRRKLGRLLPTPVRGRPRTSEENAGEAPQLIPRRQAHDLRRLGDLPDETVERAKQQALETGRPISERSLIREHQKATRAAAGPAEPEIPAQPEPAPSEAEQQDDAAWARAQEDRKRDDLVTFLQERIAFMEAVDHDPYNGAQNRLDAMQAELEAMRASRDEMQTHRYEAERSAKAKDMTIREHRKANVRARKQIDASTRFIKSEGRWPAYLEWLKAENIDLSDD